MTKAIVGNAINRLDAEGMPVRFLREVCHRCNVLPQLLSNLDSYNDLLNIIFLTSETTACLERIELGTLPDVTAAVGVLYHECSHAYIDLMIEAGDAHTMSFISSQTAHYAGAPLISGGSVEDPERQAQEAVGMCVESRVIAYFGAMNQAIWILKSCQRQHRERGLTEAQRRFWLAEIERIPRRYNREMASRIFGYEQYPPFFGEQYHVARSISSAMKLFVGHTLLEGRFPDNFENSGRPKRKYLFAKQAILNL